MSTRSAIDAAALLNEVLAHEPEVMSELFRFRVPFHSQQLADHPNVQVGVTSDGAFDLGFLGILNGIFGSEKDRLAIVTDDDFYTNPDSLIKSFTAYTDYPNGVRAK